MAEDHPDIVDADLADYFGSIPHTEFMMSVARRIVDRRVLHLIRMWLDCPVVETDQRGRKTRTTEAGQSTRHPARLTHLTTAGESLHATLVYIPPYSPDLNPIEMVFAKIKSILRKKALRTVAALWEELGKITECVSPTECRNYLRHAGYFQSG